MKNQVMVEAKKNEAGVAMLEVLISILMLALGVLALVGLQASMNVNATESKYRAEASFLANQLVGQMWVDQVNLDKYAVSAGTCSQSYTACTNWIAGVANRLPSGGADVTINGTAVTISVTWQTPGGGLPHSYQLNAIVAS
ncbi:MAG: type IV pilus modification PilV family protein [Betaproteobacteria bacterium]